MVQTSIPTAFDARGHDHAACVNAALDHADRLCAERGLRLTPIRRRVLELVWSNHKPSKAYDLLNRIRDEHHAAAPPTVYRALDFLLDAGLVHRIESLNAFVGCDGDHGRAPPKFLICQACDHVAELAGGHVDEAIDRATEAVGFQVQGSVVELRGLCAGCAAQR
ncbi:transcriptional repressor [Salinisphaera sp. P385]|uniref:Transcriptional repressor n=1 Tax=Spectribacter acetivorans TaxID=3075603 RepID=A0ABU3BAF7_9GAMM|nr:transcriptional repressor [Salinisphaera sp. P385]MDT0618812.1 transcriptional repressor [Salinisphaera sp. P385]